MEPVEALKARRACEPTMPVEVGLMAHEIQPEEVAGVAWNAMEREELEGV
jgi:hypothetical protein